MALSNLFGWAKKNEEVVASACGSACGAGDKPEEKPAGFLLDVDMQFVTDKRVHFIVQIGNAFPDTVSGRVYSFLLQQQGIPEIRITQEFVVIPRDYVYTVAFAAVVTIHGKIILCQRYEGCA